MPLPVQVLRHVSSSVIHLLRAARTVFSGIFLIRLCCLVVLDRLRLFLFLNWAKLHFRNPSFPWLQNGFLHSMSPLQLHHPIGQPRRNRKSLPPLPNLCLHPNLPNLIQSRDTKLKLFNLSFHHFRMRDPKLKMSNRKWSHLYWRNLRTRIPNCSLRFHRLDWGRRGLRKSAYWEKGQVD